MANCDEEKKICLFARQNLELCALSDQTLDQMSNCPYFQCLVLSQKSIVRIPKQEAKVASTEPKIRAHSVGAVMSHEPPKN